MQTHTLKLARPLKNVVQIPTSATQLTANLLADVDLSADPKLTATVPDGSAKNPSPSLDVQKLLTKIQQQIEQSRQNELATVQQFQELAIRLAVQIASTVVQYEVEHHDTRIRKLIENYSEKNESQGPVVLWVNQTDLKQLRISLPDLTSADSTFQLKEDESLTTGDCRLESPNQNVVANYERQLADIQLQLMEALQNARVAGGNTDERD